ncbi:ZIP family metal transporter [Haloarcula sebkhae]|uniref:ZIP family metal transporter n=2 Tax=Haloarcula sebkhae TaxID=932660 RepID=A0ACC6VGK4_9EURY|nr:metal transporter [Haloarcula sebkhae]GGK52210.1 metal transporter [Haloarcula sebkhae]
MSDRERTDGGTVDAKSEMPFGVPTWVGAVTPLILLAIVVAGFLLATPFAGLETGEAPPDVSITHTSLPNDETIVLHVTNNGPNQVTVSQVHVNDAYWDFTLYAGGEETETLGSMESGRIVVPYHWTSGWDIHTKIVLDNGATFGHTIPAPAVNPGLTGDLIGLLAVIGLFVGVIPVVLGMLWFPVMQRMSVRALHGTLMFAIGVLAFLAFDAGFEAFELAEQIPGAYEGSLLVVLGILSALLLIQAVSKWNADRVSPLGLAYLVALSIGLHNLAEGLAIGSSIALGKVSLGAFLVIGFMIHNVTEGPAVVAPVADGKRPSLAHFAALGLIAGAPVIFGGWIGSVAFSPTLGALFLAIGVGAILQVNWEIGTMIRDQGSLGTATNVFAFLLGLVIMYATDLLVAL